MLRFLGPRYGGGPSSAETYALNLQAQLGFRDYVASRPLHARRFGRRPRLRFSATLKS